MNAWDTLGIDRHADADTINQAFRILSRQHHPDMGGSADAMQELLAARTYMLRQCTVRPVASRYRAFEYHPLVDVRA